MSLLKNRSPGPTDSSYKNPHLGGADIYRTGYPLLQAGGGGHNVCRGSCTYRLADGVSGSHADLSRCKTHMRDPTVGPHRKEDSPLANLPARAPQP